MSRVNPSDVRDIAIAGAVGVFGYGVYRFFNPSEPDPTDGEGGHVEPAPEDDRPATFTESRARQLAGEIFAALYGFTEDEQAVVDAMVQAEVDADVRLLINAYGDRALNFAWLNARTLAQAVSMYLSDGDRGAINDDYIVKGISYRF